MCFKFKSQEPEESVTFMYKIAKVMFTNDDDDDGDDVTLRTNNNAIPHNHDDILFQKPTCFFN